MIYFGNGSTMVVTSECLADDDMTTMDKITDTNEYQSECLADDDMTTMDKITDTNEYQNSPTFREGNIAVSTKRSSVRCFAWSCLWSKSVDGHVYVAYNLSSEYCDCWSYLGVNGGPQALSLQSPGCMWSEIASHELMHTLGFVHEQSKIDRDKYITILLANVLKVTSNPAGLTFTEGDIAVSNKRSAITCSGNSCLWPKSVDGFVYVPYIISPEYNNRDRITIEIGMQDISTGTCIKFVPRTHQADYLDIQPRFGFAFSEDGAPTIIPKPDPHVLIGQRDGPSATDLLKINKLYNCGDY
ncbi:UNVERIFIED_CONTAM: hypothetical protein FKN15_078256 [Acipenser sinensis]